MKRGTQRLAILLAILGSGVAGWWITRSASQPAPVKQVVEAPAPKPVYDPPPLEKKTEKRPSVKIQRDTAAEEEGALEYQRSLRFSSREAMEQFLTKAKSKGIAILGSIDQLNALHVGFLSLDDLNGLLDGSEETAYIYPVNLPTPATEGLPEGAVGMGDTLLSWLGIKGDNANFGANVKFVVLDTGSTLDGANNRNFVKLPENPADQNGHGTAVNDLIKQIAPAADVASYRIADDNGRSNTFLMTQGIMAALEARVDIINISMGSYGNSALLKDAVDQALAAGIKIFASAGNEGYTQVSYPAAYEGVVSVGAVDANGSYLPFSNSGSVSVTAPGLDLLTAWTGGKTVYFTGTSASAPIVAAATAAVMSQGGPKTTSSSAYSKLTDYLNDAGAPGDDSYYGSGMVDLGRVFQGGVAGIPDAAIAANYISTNANGQTQLQVVVQNRGTTTLINAPVTVTTPAGTSTMYVSTLRPGAISTFTLPLTVTDAGARVQSQVSNGSGDIKPSNNRRTDVYAAPTSN
ncbi:S8 family serine peptidase [Luteolibacter sp. GHJ8]|uniref:S8 family serine peptidase n=1 Tax=Luteolibacter rhizosphaerae TaxID=2989719 RepID=A0ABT3G7I2_9BACT|nr:S8 family serine peptidase [Luteolibacter rhizosphaerae]MCW1915587.1 S8 family serine peptidase [Luteolibacter rhizosphaerae]